MDAEERKFYEQGMARIKAKIPVDRELVLPITKCHMDCMYAKGATPDTHSVVVLPGGGYEFLSYRESRQVAKAFNQAGFNAYVLYYSCKDNQEALSSGGLGIQPMREVVEAIATIRSQHSSNAKVALCGFSAGGHLAACMSTLSSHKEWFSDLTKEQSIRPDAVVLCYPVLSARRQITHEGSFISLTGSQDVEAWRQFSCDLNITNDTTPTFIWHTATDNAVSVSNSLIYATALWNKGISTELVVFPEGGHGSLLANNEVEFEGEFAGADPHIAQWLERAVMFLRDIVAMN